MANLNDLRQTALTCRGHTRPVTFLAFSDVTPDGYFLASACKDGRAMLRLGATGDWIGTLEKHKGAVWCVAINSMATRAVTASADHTVKIWDLLNGNEIHQLEHKGIVKSVAMSKNSNRIITCGQDKSLMMYRLDRLSQSSPEEFEGPEVGSRHVIFGSTEKEIYVASEDGGLTLTDLRTGTVVATHTFPDVIKDLRFNPSKNSMLLCHGLRADMWDIRAQSVSKSFVLNCGVLSGDFHPTEQTLTLGCDDHKLYKYSTLGDPELFETSRGHFGPIHAVRYSPDGELIASGSEDGTVRLWQHNVGKTYGLWKGVAMSGTGAPLARSPPFAPSNGVVKMSKSVEEVTCEEEEDDISNSIEIEEEPSAGTDAPPPPVPLAQADKTQNASSPANTKEEAQVESGDKKPEDPSTDEAVDVVDKSKLKLEAPSACGDVPAAVKPDEKAAEE